MILTIFTICSAQITYGDFFSDTVYNNEIEYEKLDNIKIKQIYFKSYAYNKKFQDSKAFIEEFKNTVKIRYENGLLDYYTLYDVITDLDYLVYNLNNYYYNLKKYENTNLEVWYDLSQENLSNVRLFWNQLKYTINKYQN